MANIYEFKTRLSNDGRFITALAGSMLAELDIPNQNRMRNLNSYWNFYEGYHWEGMEDGDKPRTTKNFCRRFVDKFVAAELGGGISFKFDEKVETEVLPFLNGVWEASNKDILLTDMGQFKSVTGDGFIHVHYEPKYTSNGSLNPNLNDPFDEFPKGKISLYSVPSSVCFPEYADGYDFSHDSMTKITVMYPVKSDTAELSGSKIIPDVLMKFIYTKDTIEVWKGNVKKDTYKNELGVIPIVHFRNLLLGTSRFGIPDLDDLIPLNVELNLKDSGVSEILDYHAAPVTVVYGAKVSQLERGANKIWGGLPKDAKIENLELKSDLASSANYQKDLKIAMHQIKGVPEIALGGENLSSNVSGIALQIAFMPLVDTINMKRTLTKEGLRLVNKLIIKYALLKGMLSSAAFGTTIYKHDIDFPNILPKDAIQEIELLEREFKLGLESRRGAMQRLHRENIEAKLKEVDDDMKQNSQDYGYKPVVISQGQKLVDTATGRVIAEVAPAPVASPAGTANVSGKEVGANKEGAPMKTVSGLLNRNPPKSK